MSAGPDCLPYCVLVLPPGESESHEVKQFVSACEGLARAAGCRTRTLRSRRVRVVRGSGRSMNVLSPDNAAELYRMLHHGPVLVAAFASVRISIDPSKDPPNPRETRALETFVAYKATYGLVRKDDELAPLLERFETWRESVGCDGFGDPRALPLHVFDAGPDDLDLDSDGGAERFRQRFGGSARRRDDGGRIWEKGVRHGQGELRVAGRELPVGAHWDVSAERRAFKVANAREVWRVERKGYVNVYPDAGIRGPSSIRRGLVRRMWP